jgi:hypothetical protein
MFRTQGSNFRDTMLEHSKHEEHSFEARGSNVQLGRSNMRSWQKLIFEPKLKQSTSSKTYGLNNTPNTILSHNNTSSKNYNA